MAGKARVIIVGAGIAGLSAAQFLLKHGFSNVTILEAKERVGGRMCTTEFGHHGDEIIELGANWVHGDAANNSILVLANEQKLLKNSVYLDRMEGFSYRPDGSAIDKSLQLKLWDMFCEWEDESACYLDRSRPRPSLGRHMREKLEENLHTFPEVDRENVRCLFNCFMNYLRFHQGGYEEDCCVEDQDVAYANFLEGNIKVPRGMRSIIMSLVKQLPPTWIKLSQPVKQIKYNDSNVTVSCDNGMTYEGDHVIVTCSLGYMKKHHQDLFYPPLDQVKSKAIETMPFGKVDKIFLYWERPFWTAGLGSIKLCWPDSQFDVKNKSEWYKKIFAFDEVLNNPNVLVAWISGDEAETMETLPDDDVIETCTQLIRKFLHNPSIARADGVLKSKWATDPYVLGSYSYPNLAVCDRPGYYDDLASPLVVGGELRVMFAGEATINRCYSTMHGGRSSGLREAERLARSYNKLAKSML